MSLPTFEYLGPQYHWLTSNTVHIISVFFYFKSKRKLKEKKSVTLTLFNRAREYLVFIPDIYLISIFPLDNWSSKGLNGAAVKSKTTKNNIYYTSVDFLL